MFMYNHNLTRRFLFITVFVIFLICNILNINCGKKNGTFKDNNELRVSLTSNPMTLDPRLGSDESSYRIVEHVFRFLVQKDTLSSIIPDMAYSWDMPNDKTYIFHLRKNIYFHDGKELTSEDVKYTFESVLEPESGSPMRYAYEDIEEIITPDKYTVEFRLRKPNAPFLSNAIIGIVPRHIAEKTGKDFGLNPVGSGPFKFVRWNQDDRIILEAFDRYYGGSPKIERIIYRIIPGATTRLLSIDTGEIDFLMNDFPPEYIERFEKNSDLKVIKHVGNIYEYIGLNLENNYLKNKDVRKAIAYAVNRDEMIKSFLNNLGEKAYSPLSPVNWAYNPNVIKYEYNPKKSRMMLDKAGFPDPDGDGSLFRFSLKYKCNSLNQESRQKAQIIQNYLKDIGINLVIESCEFAKLLDDIKNSRFDMYSLKWVGISDPDIFYKMFHSSGEHRNNYFNPHLDHLIALGRKEIDINLRKKYYYEIQEILSEDLPYIGLWHKTNCAVMNKNLMGFVMFPAGDFVSMRDLWWESNN